MPCYPRLYAPYTAEDEHGTQHGSRQQSLHARPSFFCRNVLPQSSSVIRTHLDRDTLFFSRRSISAGGEVQQLEQRNHLAVRHDNERQTGIFGRNAEHFRRDRLLRLLRITVSVPSRFDDAVFHIGHGCNILLAEFSITSSVVSRICRSLSISSCPLRMMMTVQQPPESAAFLSAAS